MVDTTFASVVQVLPPNKGAPAPVRVGTAGQSDIQTSSPHVEQARLIGSESSVEAVTRQTSIAQDHGVELYQTVQEVLTPEEASANASETAKHLSVNLFA